MGQAHLNNPFDSGERRTAMEYLNELMFVLDGNYRLMRGVLTFFFWAVIMALMFSPVIGAGFVTAIFWPRRLPPFDKAIGKWSVLMLKVWGFLIFCIALVYAVYRWEGSAEALLALGAVLLPISILYVYRNARHARLVMEIVFVSVYIFVLVNALRMSYEFRISYGVSVYIVAIIAAAGNIFKKWNELEYPRAVTTSVISVILLIPFIAVTAWVSNTIPSWEWPEWYQYLVYPTMTLIFFAFGPILYVQFWIPIRGNIRRY